MNGRNPFLATSSPEAGLVLGSTLTRDRIADVDTLPLGQPPPPASLREDVQLIAALRKEICTRLFRELSNLV